MSRPPMPPDLMEGLSSPTNLSRARPPRPRQRMEWLAQVGLDAEAVVEAVGEIGHADDEGQLHDLIIGEVTLELAHRHVAQSRARRSCHTLRVEANRLVLLVEMRAPLIEGERFDLLRRDAGPLRTRRVRARAVLAAVEMRGLEVGELFVAAFQRPLVHHRGVEREEVLEGRWMVGHHSVEIRDAAGPLGQALVGRAEIVGGLLRRDGIDDGHAPPLSTRCRALADPDRARTAAGYSRHRARSESDPTASGRRTEAASDRPRSSDPTGSSG